MSNDFLVDELSTFSSEFTVQEVVELYNGGQILDARDHSKADASLENYLRNNGKETWENLKNDGVDGTVTAHADSVCSYFQEMPYFKKDSLGLPMNRVKEKGLQLESWAYINTFNNFQSVYRNSFSVQMWLKPQEGTPDATQYIYGAKDGDSQVAIYLATNGNLFGIFQVDSNVGVSYASVSSIFSGGLGVWKHVTFVYTEGSNPTVFINGVSVTVSVINTMDTSYNEMSLADNTIIGGLGNNSSIYNQYTTSITSTNSRTYEGKIDEVKLYSVALTAAQIKQNYDAEKIHHQNTSTWSDDFDSSFI